MLHSPSEQVPSKEWTTFEAGVEWLRSRLMTTDPSYVQQNWDCKYLNVRVDMRTGNMLIAPGNSAPEPSKDLVGHLRTAAAFLALREPKENADDELMRQAADVIERLSRPAHEREPPHCSTCACHLTPGISSYTVECPPIVARGVDEIPSAPEPRVSREDAFELGWRTAADWAKRDDLISDIGSPAYLQDMESAFAEGPAQPPRDGQ